MDCTNKWIYLNDRTLKKKNIVVCEFFRKEKHLNANTFLLNTSCKTKGFDDIIGQILIKDFIMRM